jgi:anti-anti-sigma factor
VLDLRELEFMDSSGVHVILDASADAGRADGRLILVRGATHVERILTLTGARDQVQILDLDPAPSPAHALLSLVRGSTPA